MVLTPDGQVLCDFAQIIASPPELCRKAVSAHRAHGCTSDQWRAEIVLMPLARGGRNGKGADGTESNITGVPRLDDLSDEDYQRLKPAKGGTFGYNARDVRGGQVYPCRLTCLQRCPNLGI